MASLRKPASCTKCDSTLFVHLFDPERWVCRNCTSIEVERPQRNDPNKCRDCKADRGSKPFKGKKNQCLECFNTYMKQWRETNPEHWRAWKKAAKKRLQKTVRKTIQKSHHSFLTALFGHIQKRINHPASAMRVIAKGKLNPACLDVQIDLDYIMSLWDSQKGRCALTGLVMAHRFNDPLSVSIDRKDSALGYVPGNVQLVCQWVNRAKNNMSNLEFKHVLLKLQCDGRYLKCDLHLEPRTPVGAFLCLVRDAVLDELWGNDRLNIVEYDENLRFVMDSGFVDLRYYDSSDELLLDLVLSTGVNKPVEWGCVGDPRPVVDVGDPDSVGRIVGLVRAGLAIV